MSRTGHAPRAAAPAPHNASSTPERLPERPPEERPDAPLTVRTLAVTYPAGYRVPPHAHEWPQLVFAASGVLTVTTARGAWVVPPLRAVWAPAGVRHQLDATGEVALRTLYLRPDRAPLLAADCTVLHVPPLLRELILDIVELGALSDGVPAHEARLTLLNELMRRARSAPLSAPLPNDPRARLVADRVLARPTADDTLEQLAAGSGASPRTLERLFRAETGLSFGRWRQQTRLLGALRLLGAGHPVGRVAERVGYRSASAFVAMFTRTLGRPPGSYFAADSE